MATQQQLNQFHEFASAKLSSAGGDQLSLDELLVLWKASEFSATVADVRESMQEEERGQLHSLAEVDEEIRADLGFSSK